MANLGSSRAITFLDVETTHLDAKRSAVLSISIITDWTDGRQDVWSTNIKPRPLELEFASKEALKICNYTEEEWSAAPSLEEVAPEIIKRLMWGPLVGHNIQFDIDHISATLVRHGYREAKRNEDVNEGNNNFRIGYPVIDTCALAFIFLPTERQNLNALRTHFEIDQSRAHNSLTDTEDCREVFYSIVAGQLDKLSPDDDD
jgi:DNA polymerase III epsilon subunit-like protein